MHKAISTSHPAARRLPLGAYLTTFEQAARELGVDVETVAKLCEFRWLKSSPGTCMVSRHSLDWLKENVEPVLSRRSWNV